MITTPVDIIRETVEAISDLAPKLSADSRNANRVINGIYFYHGHPVEIVNTLKSMALTPDLPAQRFPAICLFQDFPERIGDASVRYAEANLHIVLCSLTTPAQTASQRYDLSFKPILHPLYERFLSQLAAHPSVIAYGGFSHTKYDRVFWGKSGLYGNTANIFSDFIDAIEIENLTLKFNQTTSC